MAKLSVLVAGFDILGFVVQSSILAAESILVRRFKLELAALGDVSFRIYI